MSTEKSMTTRAPSYELDTRVGARVVESLVLRGDVSGLGPAERAKFYVGMCESLGLNPHAQPFAYLRLNGKEVLYATRGATDSLAAIHKLNREIIDGPKVIDLAGTKLVYCVCRATHPNGRIETATATVPLVDPVNVMMKVETKAKRRATLSILGLGVLDEMELETIPAGVQEPGGGVDLSLAPRAEVTVEPQREVLPMLERAYDHIAQIELPGESVAVWLKHRTDLATLPAPDREAAWKALCTRTEEVGKMKNAKVWLKKAIAEEDARRAADGSADHQHAAAGAPLDEVQPQDAPTGEGAPDTHDLDSDAGKEPEGPSSHAYGHFVDVIAGQPTLAGVRKAYNDLMTGLHEEGCEDLEHFLGGSDGAFERARQRMELLRYRLVSTEVRRLLASRPLAELADTMDHIRPGPDGLKNASQWWIDKRGARMALDPSDRMVLWLPLVRKYSGASQAAEVKKASAALKEGVKILDKPPPTTGSDAPKASVNAPANGNGGAAAASSTSAAARAQVETFREHLHNIRRDGDDRGTGHVAGSWWKRADMFRAMGLHALCLAVVLDELTERGVAEAHTWLDEIGERNGYVKRPARAA